MIEVYDVISVALIQTGVRRFPKNRLHRPRIPEQRIFVLVVHNERRLSRQSKYSYYTENRQQVVFLRALEQHRKKQNRFFQPLNIRKNRPQVVLLTPHTSAKYYYCEFKAKEFL